MFFWKIFIGRVHMITHITFNNNEILVMKNDAC